MAKPKDNPNYKVIAENRRARYDYAIEDDVECGIVLQGSEVKSLRTGQSNIAESYAAVEDGELWGNYPQTYSLVGIINCAVMLSRSWTDVR